MISRTDPVIIQNVQIGIFSAGDVRMWWKKFGSLLAYSYICKWKLDYLTKQIHKKIWI